MVQTGANACTPTITPNQKYLGVVPVASPYGQIPANTTVSLGPFAMDKYNGNTSGAVVAATNQVAVSWAGTTAGVNVWVLQVPDAQQPL